MGVGGNHCQIFSQAGEPVSSGRQLPTYTIQETRKGWAWLLWEGFLEEGTLSQAWGEVCWAVWMEPGGQRVGLGTANSVVGEDSLLGWSYQPRVGAPAFSGSSRAMGHQARDKHSFLSPRRKLSPRDQPLLSCSRY